MSTHSYRHKGEVLRGRAIAIDPWWNDMARCGSQQLLTAMLRYGIKNGGVLSISAAQCRARLGGRP